MDLKINPWFMLSIIFIFFSLKSPFSLGTDRITANRSLSGDQTIVSAGGIFKLGFFRPGKSSRYYVGIWYNEVSQQTVVWVANRETPVSDRFSSELRILNGNLVLFNESKRPIWSTNLSPPSSHVEVVLLDVGNLILGNGQNLSEPLWQSFDHPTDTWLPGAKLCNGAVLTSWKSREDPAPAKFSFTGDSIRWDGGYYHAASPSNGYDTVWSASSNSNGYDYFWSPSNLENGSWSTFDSVFGIEVNYVYDFENSYCRSYFISSSDNSSIISRLVIDVQGCIQQQLWLEAEQRWNIFWSSESAHCKVYGYCGAFGSCNVESPPYCHCFRGFSPKSLDGWSLQDFSQGCVRRTSLQCENSGHTNTKRDRFFPSFRMTALYPQTMAIRSVAKCELTCLNICSCTAYAHDGYNCFIWHGDLLSMQQMAVGDPRQMTLYIRLAASEFANNKKNIIIGSVVGSLLTIILGLVLLGIWRIRRGRTKVPEVIDGLMVFRYGDLKNATKNFSVKLGEGGFGSVFKGILPNSRILAVKKLEIKSLEEKQFRAEVTIIGMIQHFNLIRLHGFCSEGTKKLLVYDYMPNGSLNTHLFHENTSNVLDWKTRYPIALGTARGLAYLHEKCRDCIIHCDIKPDNILLDADFCPKISDFGLAKLFGHDFSRVLTTMRGTRGYLAPEWISGEAITVKADVYSYGMMLFEIVSGRRNSEQPKGIRTRYFPLRAICQLLEEDSDVLSLLDPRLDGKGDIEEITRVCKVAGWCIQTDENIRPSMSQVVYILEGVLDVNLPPIPSFLQGIEDDDCEHATFLVAEFRA